MAPAVRRLNIGFHGGQVLALRMDNDQLEALQRALGSSGWHELSSEDGPVRLDLSQVVYVQVEGHEQRVGFGA